MWVTIARKEALEILRSPKFAGTFAVCSLLVLLAFYVGGRGFLLERERWEAARTETLRQMEGETDWLEIAPTVSLPPQPIAGLVGGVAHDIGRHATVAGRGAIRPFGSRYGSDPVFAVFRFLDLEFVFRIVLSLFALLFAYDAICGEKERGTLRLCFSYGVGRPAFLAGKMVGTLGALLLPFLVPVGLGVLLWLVQGIPMDAESWTRVLLLVLAGFLYVACFLTLAVWVSATTPRSSHSFLLLLSIWVVVVLVAPRAAVALSARQVPVLSTDEIQAESSRLRSQLWSEDRRQLDRLMNGTLQGGDSEQSMEERVARLTQSIDDMAATRDQKLKEHERSLLEKRRSQQASQRSLAFGLASISPAAVLNLAAQEIAGTSLRLEVQFLEDLQSYQTEFGRFQAEKSGGRQGGGGIRVQIQTGEEQTEPEPIDPSELPPFQSRAPSLQSGVAAALPRLALLTGFNLLFFTAAFVSFLRYDPR